MVSDEHCPTCEGFGRVFASRDVERPELDRWYACPDCTVSHPQGSDEPNQQGGDR